jgi:glycosyltransferase involved in cell wall biosynthesis
MSTNTIVHITHTDINNDWRIRKEIEAVLGVLGPSETLSIYSINSGIDPNPFDSHVVNVFNFNEPAFLKHLHKYFRLPISLILFTIYLCQNLNFKKIQICHVHDTAVLHLGYLIKLFSQCTLIYDAHELESQKNMQSWLFSRATLLLEKIFWSKVDILISVSQGIIDWYDSSFSKKKSILVLNSPDKIEKFQTDIVINLKDFYGLESEKMFIYIGLLQKGRGIEKLLKVFSDMEHHIVFLGFGNLDNLIHSYESKYSNIHLYKHVPNHILIPTISSADFGICTIDNVSTSDYLALPNKFFEYLFAGLPVLVSNFPELRRYTSKLNVGLTTELDINSIRTGVMTLAESNFTIDNSLLQELSWNFQKKKLFDLYTDILNDKL